MSAFADLDELLNSWARDHRLLMNTRYRDEEVRSFQVVGPTGEKAQIWVEIDETISIHVWDYSKKKRALETTRENLIEQLDAALKLASEWTTWGLSGCP